MPIRLMLVFFSSKLIQNTMTLRTLSLFFATLLMSAAQPAGAQLLADTIFTWQGYARTSTCHLHIYKTSPDEERTHTVVIRELAENDGPSTVSDARHLVELVGRQFDVGPAQAYWIFYWGSFSYEGAEPNKRKELFLRATFRRTRSQSLSTPSWKVISREEVENYTDRLFR